MGNIREKINYLKINKKAIDLFIVGMNAVCQFYRQHFKLIQLTIWTSIACSFFFEYFVNKKYNWQWGDRAVVDESWKSAFNFSFYNWFFFFFRLLCGVTNKLGLNRLQIPKSLLFGRISIPSSSIQASTYTKSAINDGRLHLSMAALPRNTNSSMTRVW